MSLISCPECSRQISEHAVACPGCGHPINSAPPIIFSAPAPRAQKKKTSAIAWLFLILSCLILFPIVVGSFKHASDVLANPALLDAKPAPDYRWQAFYHAKNFCLDHMAAPSTAKFSRLDWDEKTGCKLLTNDLWYSCGFVDAQNSYGAMIRSDWGALLLHTNDSFNLIFLSLGDRQWGLWPQDLNQHP